MNTRCLLAALLLSSAPLALGEKLQSLAPANPAPGNERRVALVIGNGAYKSSPLRNPVNDSRAMARVLAETGFAVTLLEDASRAGMHRAVRMFGDELLRGGAGLFYFAGHGMQVRGRNYLVPVDVEIEREDEVEFQAVDANLVLVKMDSAKNSLNLMILDACRNNPFARSFRSAALGLAQMDAPSGTLVAFATAPGSVAADGEGANGLYTKHLLKELRQPGLPVEQLFKRVRVGVSIETGDRQVPWESSSLKGDFFFIPGDPGKASQAQRAVIDQAVSAAVRKSEERAAKERAALQAEMRSMVAEMLALQREQLAMESRQRAPAQAPAPSKPAARIEPAPLPSKPAARIEPAREKSEVALAAPTAVAMPHTAMPKAGDRWVYRTWTHDKPQDVRESRVEVKAVSDEGIVEETRSGGGKPFPWAYTAELYVIGRGPGLIAFLPYLPAYHALTPGQRWRNLPYRSMGACTQNPNYRCRYDGKVIGREEVTVPAGTFDAWKVEVELSGVSGTAAWSRTYTYWYAERTRRLVKYTARGNVAFDPQVDYVLASYQLR